MRPSSGGINIASSAQKLDVDNRISLRYYYRIADNILKQADIFRGEKNIIDLYIMLLRFSSLTSETIPCHRDYKASPQIKKNALKKNLLRAMNELEELKPAVRQKIDELNQKHTYQVNRWGVDSSLEWPHVRKQTLTNHEREKIDESNQKHTYQVNRWGVDSSLEWPHVRKQTLTNHERAKTPRSTAQDFEYQGSKIQQFSHAKPVEEQFRRLSVGILRPREETLSRHSILGPNGLRGQWQPPTVDKRVQYPSNLDLTPVQIPSLQHHVEDGLMNKNEASSSEHEQSSLESVLALNEDNQVHHAEEPGSLISFDTTETPSHLEIIRQPSPPPVLANVQDLIPETPTPVSELDYQVGTPSVDGLVCSEAPLEMHISTVLMESFLKLAKSNTVRNLETCGILAGSLKNRKFYVSALIIPKQESTSDSCQTTNEEEIFEVQDKQSLFPLGWIHTHPTQSCFMSSVDLHTHYSYQTMLPEAIAIVMAPRDASKKHGIFRLTTPGGMSVIRHCDQRGFHPHHPPSDGGPIYKSCTDVYMNPNIHFDVIDLR